jgi:hypothetical protein
MGSRAEERLWGGNQSVQFRACDYKSGHPPKEPSLPYSGLLGVGFTVSGPQRAGRNDVEAAGIKNVVLFKLDLGVAGAVVANGDTIGLIRRGGDATLNVWKLPPRFVTGRVGLVLRHSGSLT